MAAQLEIGVAVKVTGGDIETPSAFALAGGQRGCDKNHSHFCHVAWTDHTWSEERESLESSSF